MIQTEERMTAMVNKMIKKSCYHRFGTRFSSLPGKTFNRVPMTVFKDKLLARTYIQDNMMCLSVKPK